MAYVIEIDDLSKHIVYPPRGMEFEPASPAAPVPDTIPPEPTPLWQQNEFRFAENNPPNPQ